MDRLKEGTPNNSPEKTTPVWEQVAEATSRLEVPDGWLYRVYQYGVVFVPKPPVYR